jgi:hypothetical protein
MLRYVCPACSNTFVGRSWFLALNNALLVHLYFLISFFTPALIKYALSHSMDLSLYHFQTGRLSFEKKLKSPFLFAFSRDSILYQLASLIPAWTDLCHHGNPYTPRMP